MNWQTTIALIIVAITLITVLYHTLKPKKKTSCGSGCGCGCEVKFLSKDHGG